MAILTFNNLPSINDNYQITDPRNKDALYNRLISAFDQYYQNNYDPQANITSLSPGPGAFYYFRQQLQAIIDMYYATKNVSYLNSAKELVNKAMGDAQINSLDFLYYGASRGVYPCFSAEGQLEYTGGPGQLNDFQGAAGLMMVASALKKAGLTGWEDISDFVEQNIVEKWLYYNPIYTIESFIGTTFNSRTNLLHILNTSFDKRLHFASICLDLVELGYNKYPYSDWAEFLFDIFLTEKSSLDAPYPDSIYRSIVPTDWGIYNDGNGTLIWSWGLSNLEDYGTLDTSHANRTAWSVCQILEKGITDNYATLNNMITSFKKNIWAPDTGDFYFNNYIDGNDGLCDGVGPGQKGNIWFGWHRLAKYDSSLKNLFISIAYDLTNGGTNVTGQNSSMTEAPLCLIAAAARSLVNINFDIETTGGRFEYSTGVMNIYQGLGVKETKRLVASITFDSSPIFTPIVSTADRVLFYSDNINLGIYGDSTLIIYPKAELTINCLGSVNFDYQGEDGDEVLLSDNLGGISIFPQRHETGFVVNTIDLNKINWEVSYTLSVGNRVMIASFPGRPFDLQNYKDFKLVNYWFYTSGTAYPGVYPNSERMATLEAAGIKYFGSTDFQNMYAANPLSPTPSSYNGTYPGAPFTPHTPVELNRIVQECHQRGMKFYIYASLWYSIDTGYTKSTYLAHLRNLKETYGIDGCYVDGMLTDYGTQPVNQRSDRIGNWETARCLRQIFGEDGILIYHNTEVKDSGSFTYSKTRPSPNTNTYYNLTVTGENIPLEEINDITSDYVQYQVRQYGMSNTIGLWYFGSHNGVYDRTISDNDYATQAVGIYCNMWNSLTNESAYYENSMFSLIQSKIDIL